MKKKLQIFISSTFTDLLEERQAAVAAILKAGHIPAGMELFTAGDESQMETIKRWIDDSDIYMLILAGRYGSIEPITSLSYSELEYDYAMQNEIPLFAVIIEEKALDEKVKDLGKDVLERKHPQELDLFREKVLSKTSSFFSDPKDIKLAVYETISDFEARYDLKGWIHGNDIPDVKPLQEEIGHLRDRNAELTDQLAVQNESASQHKGDGHDEKGFDELINILLNIKIETTIHGDSGEDTLVKTNLHKIFLAAKEALVVGITNQHGMDENEQFLYFNVCAKLQIHGLMQNEKIAGVQYRRFALTKKGADLLAYIEKLNFKKSGAKTTKEDKTKNGDKKG